MASVAPPPVGGLRMEVACCDADHEGEWEGEWEECEVVADHGETCDVRIVEDGEVCCGVPRRMVRAIVTTGRSSRPPATQPHSGAFASAAFASGGGPKSLAARVAARAALLSPDEGLAPRPVRSRSVGAAWRYLPAPTPTLTLTLTTDD